MAVEIRQVRGLYEALAALAMWLDSCMHEERDQVVAEQYRTVAARVCEIQERVLMLLEALEAERLPPY